MSKLPQIPYGSRLQKMTQVQFGGLRHNDNCADGEIYDMINLSSDHWPCLGTREPREAVGEGWPGETLLCRRGYLSVRCRGQRTGDLLSEH